MNNKNNNLVAAEYFCVSEGTIRRIKKNFNKQQSTRLKRVKRSTRKSSKYPQLEKELFTWFQKMREDKLVVNTNNLRTTALKLAQDLCLMDFKASNGFIHKFMIRNNLRRRVATHYLQKVSNEVMENVKTFLTDLTKYRLDFITKKIKGETDKDLCIIINLIF